MTCVTEMGRGQRSVSAQYFNAIFSHSNYLHNYVFSLPLLLNPLPNSSQLAHRPTLPLQTIPPTHQLVHYHFAHSPSRPLTKLPTHQVAHSPSCPPFYNPRKIVLQPWGWVGANMPLLSGVMLLWDRNQQPW